MKTDLYQSVKTGVADTMLNKDSRTQKSEETKINAGSLQRGFGQPQNQGGIKARMEDIKEQDTESEPQRDPPTKPAQQAAPSDGIPIGRKISEAQSKNYKLSTEL